MAVNPREPAIALNRLDERLGFTPGIERGRRRRRAHGPGRPAAAIRDQASVLNRPALTSNLRVRAHRRAWPAMSASDLNRLGMSGGGSRPASSGAGDVGEPVSVVMAANPLDLNRLDERLAFTPGIERGRRHRRAPWSWPWPRTTPRAGDRLEPAGDERRGFTPGIERGRRRRRAHSHGHDREPSRDLASVLNRRTFTPTGRLSRPPSGLAPTVDRGRRCRRAT